MGKEKKKSKVEKEKKKVKVKGKAGNTGKPLREKPTQNQFCRLALIERFGLKLLRTECPECKTAPDVNKALSWACVCVINDDRTLNDSETYVVRYEYLSSEREVLYSDASGKNVSFCVLIG